MATTYLTCDVGSPNQQRFTWSLWVKRSKLGVEQHLAGNNVDGNNRTHLFITNTEKLYFFSNLSGSNVIAYQTNRLFRDLNAWYHIVCAVDTTQAGGNRIRIYVNGEEETSFATETECNQNTNLSISGTHYIGTYGGSAGSASYSFDGSISHLHFVDGSQLTPSSFGSTDATTGEWKINTSPSVTYGSSGYFILKDGNSVTDQSGNSNNFTVAGGTLTKTEDNPSNVFATFNPLYNSGGTVTYSAGANRFAEADNQWKTTFSTLGASSGKYYAEFKCNGNYMMVGVADYNVTKSGIADRNFSSTTYISEQGYGIYNGNGDLYYRGSSTSYADTYGSGDIIGVALDCDNNRVFFSKNGVWQNSADPTNASSGFSMTATDATYVFAIAVQNDECHANFGNGYFNTTAIASAGTNASNLGIFEYDVPSGYTALCTKGLNE